MRVLLKPRGAWPIVRNVRRDWLRGTRPVWRDFGETGAGKTTVVQTWLAQRGEKEREEGDRLSIPVLSVLMPSHARKKGAAAAFLGALHDPNPSRGTEWNMLVRLYRLMQVCQVRLIVVDKFQHIIDRETQRVLHDVADFLKDIINQTRVPMILVGKKGEAEAILRSNPQLDRRVGSPYVLGPFEWDRSRASETIKEFRTVRATRLIGPCPWIGQDYRKRRWHVDCFVPVRDIWGG